ncbi:TPM domain-containing protein [Sphingobacterium psychroaquaticum]|uniref:TLP18.3, Psb32 and MOLO-1 founding protein of phosphatase n=1 Tax=Sphingobacterium psychroaquaticum TaxID=561061 RepID=A0A1X7KJF7_9SPHI|nr:TPM domain-containing protein [Sphingobacterium psychroaquaticum]SMG41196.1 TLP18.3, Psb32 and MOLO-1 founding protein of phosphatase [Sphingobacterium psychroaquaticum]
MDIFSIAEQDRIVQAISVAEGKTSGEIRLVVERKLKHKAAIEAAVKYFRKLDMHKTILKNGVLIYIAVDDHEFAIIGDTAIHDRVGEDFWGATQEEMVSFFRQDMLVDGLIAGIQQIGEQLQYFFPRKADDINELPDDIYYGEN